MRRTGGVCDGVWMGRKPSQAATGPGNWKTGEVSWRLSSAVGRGFGGNDTVCAHVAEIIFGMRQCTEDALLLPLT